LQTQLALLPVHGAIDELSPQYCLESQHVCVGAQGAAGSAQTDRFTHAQLAPAVQSCDGFPAARQEAPDSQQSGFCVVQASPVGAHASSPQSFVAESQVSPSQHGWVSQLCVSPPQSGGGGAQVPSTQSSFTLQQGEVAVHAWPDSEQVGPEVGALQAPAVAPGAMSQESPVQQSASTVQLAVSGWHVTRQIPWSHAPAQHWPGPVHAPPSVTHSSTPPWESAQK
jgi:hypothetical protein